MAYHSNSTNYVRKTLSAYVFKVASSPVAQFIDYLFTPTLAWGCVFSLLGEVPVVKGVLGQASHYTSWW